MDDFVRVLFINTMGQSILIETLKSAAYFIMRSGNFHTKRRETYKNFLESRYCYFFVQSTALDVLIQTYDLGYDPDQLRDGFHYLVSHSSQTVAGGCT